MTRYGELILAIGIWIVALCLTLSYERVIKNQQAEIDSLKATNSRLLERKIVYDTIPTYIFRGFVEE